METLFKGEEAASGICALTGGLTEEDTSLVFFRVKWFVFFHLIYLCLVEW